MLFNSFEFFIFFAIVVTGYWLLSANRNLRVGLLILASYYFYMSWNWKFAGLILGSTLLDYFIGGRIHRSVEHKTRKAYLLVSLVGNLGCLAVFKYFNFFVDSFNAFITNFGFDTTLVNLNIILPVGISFYTFQTMSYTIDIYKGELEPAKSFSDFALFVAFFPQLVAGPIVRASEFLPQLKEKPKYSDSQAIEGVSQILLGLFKKICIGDVVAAALVDPAFDNPGMFSGLSLLFAVYGYALQIYCDFSGYSDVAIGAARILGFNLPVNFNRPYQAKSITEFWRRWHISLSSWLRDYLYIPLGGNHKGVVRTYTNLMVTMLLGGLWHGAAWNFVIWGGLQGVFLAGERLLFGGRVVSEIEKRSATEKFIRQILTFHLVCLSWILFRASSAESGFIILKRIITMADGLNGFSVHFLVALTIGVIVHFIPQSWKPEFSKRLFNVNIYVRAGVVMFFLVSFMVFGIDDAPFIYFQF
jgi:D-alanyl-lipoteichoic acid acyltransferase DltB (MBOAT superfamily)